MLASNSGNKEAENELRERDVLAEMCNKQLQKRNLSCAKLVILYGTGDVEWDSQELVRNNKRRNINALCTLGWFRNQLAIDAYWQKIKRRQRKIWDHHGTLSLYADKLDAIPAYAERGYPADLYARLFCRPWFRAWDDVVLPGLQVRYLLLTEMLEVKDVRDYILALLRQL